MYPKNIDLPTGPSESYSDLGKVLENPDLPLTPEEEEMLCPS